MAKVRQLELDFGVSEEQACIMCHLSSECGGCCIKCHAQGKNNGCQGQACSRPFMAQDKDRWNTWMYLVATSLPELKRFVPKKFRKLLKQYS